MGKSFFVETPEINYNSVCANTLSVQDVNWSLVIKDKSLQALFIHRDQSPKVKLNFLEKIEMNYKSVFADTPQQLVFIETSLYGQEVICRDQSLRARV